ncbi:DUF2075 domain-containing protein [Paenibacillus massiliensis]|uniref:DUF2075 domain-containing protein n=1 Tax=Paenibacillus massiliensis TaxID=225917 RepID=UPI000371094E|nr:DUF2075 domain-containing protein [Paenibacillus massiliensis]
MTSELIIEKINFSSQDLQQIKEEFLTRHPVVYIFYNQDSLQAYVGETVQFKRRLREHLNDKRRNKKLQQIILIGHKRFHQSATYNIETNLINYLIAENRYRLQNVSQTKKSEMHNYYQKQYYNEEIFTEIWKTLKDEQLIQEPLETLRNKDTYKLSPYKELTPQQVEVKNQILKYCKENDYKTESKILIIEGDAGTGKSVLISSLFNTIQDLSHENGSTLKKKMNYLLVNHGEMLKTYHSLTKSLPNIKKNKVMKPTTFINNKKITSADIVLVDEAHLLLTKEDRYNSFNGKNHLEEIIKKSKITILIFDPKQVLRIKSYWDDDLLKKVTKQYITETYYLKDQLRMYAAPEFIDWIDSFVSKKLINVPHVSQNTYDLQIFSNALAMKKAIEDRNKKVGLSRMVATFDYEHKKDGQLYYVEADGLKMPWNITDSNTIWAEKENTIHEIGSIYTVQGFDLNYVGVILGPSVSYDEQTDQLLIDVTKYKDVGAFNSRSDFSEKEIQQIKQDIILNSINVLMKRGIRGLYIYATDPKLRKKLLSLVKR